MFALPGIKIGWMAVSGDPALVKKAMPALDLMSDTFLPVNEIAQFAVPDIFRRGSDFLRSCRVLRNTFTNSLSTLAGVDTLIFACGRRSRLELFGVVAGAQPIGDALAPRRMLHATLDGARLGATI